MGGVDPIYIVASYSSSSIFLNVHESAIHCYDGLELDSTQRDRKT
jgi:hypothetical protein